MLNFLLFGGSYIAGFFFAITRNPIYAFVIYQAVYFFHPMSRWWGYMVPDIAYSFFTVILMMFVFVKDFKVHNENKLLSSPPLRWFYIIVFLYIVAMFYAVSSYHTTAMVDFIKLAVIISIAYKLCNTEAKLNLILYGYIFGAWYISFMTYQVGRNHGDRVEGVGTVDSPDANGIALAIAPALPLILYYFWQAKEKWQKALFGIAGIFVANALVLINSRGAFLGAAISLMFFMFYMFFSSTRIKHQRKVVFFIVILGCAGAVKIVDQSFIERMLSIKQSTEVDKENESAATRTVFWKASWDMAQDYPFGQGYRGFNYFADFYIPKDVNTGGHRHRSVHSTWFESLSEIGYLGLFAVIMMIISSFRALNRCKKYLREKGDVINYYKMLAIQSSLLSFIVSMSFMNRLRAEVFYWIILFIACAYNVYYLKNHPVIKKVNERPKFN